jgi:hypothetical protein
VNRRIAKIGLLTAIRYRRPLLRIARHGARHPKRTIDVVGGTRLAFTAAQRVKADPRAQKHVRRAAKAASRAVVRTRKVGVVDAISDRRVLSELRAAA